MSRHVNIPIFVPHMGCPNQCVFCNQRIISGRSEFSVSAARKTIEAVLSTASGEDCEIAFFGGSFTGIERSLMLELLALAKEYVISGRVTGIRMSTRPDYITPEIIGILKSYPISCVELGVQSMDDRVLVGLKRGHTQLDTERAFALLNEASVPVVGQMMIGLPYATEESEIECAQAICRMGAVAARIYPTVVFRDTELAAWMESDRYTPLSDEDAVRRSKNVYEVFLGAGIPCLRVGLCESENLHSDSTYLAGPNHSAMGEMVMSAVYRDRIVNAIPAEETKSKTLEIRCPIGHTSKVLGHKAQTKKELIDRFGFSAVKVKESAELNDYTIKLDLI